MSFYDQHPSQHNRQPSWDPSQSTSASGLGQAAHQSDEPSAFRGQFEEIERHRETLSKSTNPPLMHGRRESLAHPFAGQFVGQLPQTQALYPRPDPSTWDSRQPDRIRQHSISEYEGLHRSASSSSSMQGFLQNQRFGPPRPSEAESMMQAKRRAAAARERELRNYHQEQQYNRGPEAKGGRAGALSPNAMNEDDRRELLSRQHRALYGENASLYDGQSRIPSQDARAGPLGSHGSSPMGFDAFRQPVSLPVEGGAQSADPAPLGSRSRSNSASSKTANAATFAMFDSANTRTSNSSPGDAATTSGSGVLPIGSRQPPSIAQAKRGTPPMPSPLGFGLTSGERPAPLTSAAPSNGSEKPAALWPSNGPWGPTQKGQSVWG